MPHLKIVPFKRRTALLFSLLFFITTPCRPEKSPVLRAYRVAIIDSYFCSRKFYAKDSLQTRFPLKQAEKGPPCHDKGPLSRAFHGHQVFREITKDLNSPEKFIFYLMNVFQRDGGQSPETWKSAIEFVNTHAIDLVITASGYFRDSSIKQEVLKPPLLAAAGNALGPLSHRPPLFPQTSASPRKYLVGSFLVSPKGGGGGLKDREIYQDPLNMNQNQISFFMTGQIPKHPLSGTSLAVALGAHFFLKHCAPKSVEDCLKTHSIPFSFKGKENMGPQKTFPLARN